MSNGNFQSSYTQIWFLAENMERERNVTISYLAKLAGVRGETIRRDVKELRSIIELESLEGAS
jgi:DeoR/GlpR family transcriptional regulator of sugar metabolism